MAVLMNPRRVLLMYATMTKNTEKVAAWFRETFVQYGWEVTYLRIAANTDWAGLQEQLYFDDYDLICLGSPIVGGAPLQAVIKAFSFGAGGTLEKEVQTNLDQQKADPAAPAKKTGRRQLAPSPGPCARHARSRELQAPRNRIFHLWRRLLRFR